MKISSRFSIAVHIVVAIVLLSGTQKMTSDFLASCINVNPVVIRRILGRLKKAGLADVKSGEGGAFLLKEATEITLLDIYRAVETAEDMSLFNSHKQPEPGCPLECAGCPRAEQPNTAEEGLNSGEACCFIHNNIENHLKTAQEAMEQSLKETTVRQMILELTGQ